MTYPFIHINIGKIGILVILAKFGLIFQHEVVKLAKKPEYMLKRIVLASQKPKQIWKSSLETLWD